MPSRKTFKYKKRRYKRKYKKKRSNKMKISSLSLRGVSAMPDTLFCKLKYSDIKNMVNVAGSGSLIFSMNSLFDPDVTGVGHQPLGFDEWGAFYSHYEVLASRIRIDPQATTGVNPIEIVLYPSRQQVIQTMSTAREQPYGKKSNYTSSTGAQFASVINYMKVKKFEGRSTNSINFAADTSVSPATQFYWILQARDANGGDISPVTWQVDIVYYVKFFRRLTLTAS